jgi:hypothetical protein
MESEAQYGYGNGLFISHDELMKRYNTRKDETTLTATQREALDEN